MTYKHDNFESSEVMRSLERLSLEKGLIKPDPIQKKAEVKLDTNPTSNLTENIIKLCDGLRSSGFEKQAEEVETNFLNYKQAQTLYEAHKETGDDLVHSAHPKGSHKLEGVDGDEATVEDILDKHSKILQVINKKPTGKLASSKDILNAVKVAIGATPLVMKGNNTSPKKSLGQTASDLNDFNFQAAPDQTKNTTNSSIGKTVGAVAGFASSVALLKWLVTKLATSKAIDSRVLKAASEALGRKLTDAEAKAITKQILDKIGNKVMNEVLGENTASTIAKAVSESGTAAEAGAAEVAGAALAPEAGVAASWLSSLPEAIWGLGAAGIGTGVGLGIIGGVAVGNAFFNYQFNSKDIIKTGESLISDMSELNNLTIIEQGMFNKFENTFNSIKRLVIEKDNLFKDPSKENFMALSQLEDALRVSSQQAQDLWSIADTHNGVFSAISSIKPLSTNYQEVAGDLRTQIIDFFKQLKQATSKVIQNTAQNKNPVVNTNGVNQLISLLNSRKSAPQVISNPKALQWVNDEIAEINGAKSSPDLANKLIAWNNEIKDFDKQVLNKG